MTTTEDLALTVTRADGGIVRIGPIGYQRVADQMVRTFESMATNTTGAAGARYRIEPYAPKPDETYLPLVPASTDAVLTAMEDEGNNAPFPDLWSRLRAQHGYEVALQAWRPACVLSDGPDAEPEPFIDLTEKLLERGIDVGPRSGELSIATLQGLLDALDGKTYQSGFDDAGLAADKAPWEPLPVGDLMVGRFFRHRNRTDPDGSQAVCVIVGLGFTSIAFHVLSRNRTYWRGQDHFEEIVHAWLDPFAKMNPKPRNIEEQDPVSHGRRNDRGKTFEEAWARWFRDNPDVQASWAHQNGRWP